MDSPLSKRNQHVMPRKGEWAVQGAGASRATLVPPTYFEAINRWQEIARNQGTEFLIHGRDCRTRGTNAHVSCQRFAGVASEPEF